MTQTHLRWLGVAVVLALGAAAVVLLAGPADRKSATIYFDQVVGLYPGDDVKVMGVAIGSVDTITPEQDGRVRVDVTYDADAPVPADASAGIVAPTLVTGRYVQFAPVDAHGPALPDGAVIGVERTAVPVEYNEIIDQLDTLADTLGPQGADRDGALTRALGTAASTLDGHGADIRATIDSLARATGTLADGRDDLFGTVRNLQTLVTALRQADDQVGRFNTRLADVSRTLSDSSGDLSRLLDRLDESAQRIGTFVEEHRDELGGNLEGVQKVLHTVSENRQALADVLQKAPHALSNFQNIYDPLTGSAVGALASNNINDPATFVCSALTPVGGTTDLCEQALGPFADLVRQGYVPVRANPYTRPGTANKIDPRDEDATQQTGPTGGGTGLPELFAPGGHR